MYNKDNAIHIRFSMYIVASVQHALNEWYFKIIVTIMITTTTITFIIPAQGSLHI